MVEIQIILGFPKCSDWHLHISDSVSEDLDYVHEISIQVIVFRFWHFHSCNAVQETDLNDEHKKDDKEWPNVLAYLEQQLDEKHIPLMDSQEKQQLDHRDDRHQTVH